MLSINVRRGLFRLWTVASFVWLVIAGAFVQEGIRRDVSMLMTEIQPALDDSAFYIEMAARQAAQQAQAPRNLMVSASVLLLPPILAFALGWAGFWIMKGFRR